VLHDGELVGAVAHVVEEAVDERRLDPAAADGGRAGDGFAPLVARHARDQVLPLVDGFGQAPELRAVAEEVRAHRDDDVDGGVALRGRFEQELDEGGGVVGRLGRLGRGGARLLVAEQLLELVDDEEHALARVEPGLPRGVHEAERAAPQRGLDERGPHAGVGPARAEHRFVGERQREVAEGVVAGAHDGDAPARAGPGHQAAVERGQQPGADERRLAAPGGADDGEEARAAEPREQLVRLALAPEEEVVLLRLEGAEAREGVEHVAAVARHGCPPSSPRIARRKGCRASGEKAS
jgi:hypothetical protein